MLNILYKSSFRCFVRPAHGHRRVLDPAREVKKPTPGLSLALKIHSRHPEILENCFGKSENDSNIRYRAESCRIVHEMIRDTTT